MSRALREVLARREPLLLDGALGTGLLLRGYDPAREVAAEFGLRHPEEVRALHAAHVVAGAQLVLTNTFGAAAASLPACAAALEAARASGARFVAAALWAGQPGLAASVRALAGADAVWLETATSGQQALAALAEALLATTLPVVVTVVPGAASRALLDGLRARGASAAGVNCGPWPAGRGTLAQASGSWSADVLKPDASQLEPAEWAAGLVDCAAPLRGGCCDATPAHLAALAQRLRATER